MCEGGERNWGGEGNSMGLILDARSQFFFLFKNKVCLFYTRSLFGPCLPE